MVRILEVEPSKSSKLQPSSVVSLIGDTIDELEPFEVWRIGCRLVEGVIPGFDEPNESIFAVKKRGYIFEYRSRRVVAGLEIKS